MKNQISKVKKEESGRTNPLELLNLILYLETENL